VPRYQKTRHSGTSGRAGGFPPPCLARPCSSAPAAAQGSLFEKEIKGGNPAVPDDDEISPGVRQVLHQSGPDTHWDATRPLPKLLGFRQSADTEVRVSRLDGTPRTAIDLVAATVDARFGVRRNTPFFGPDLVDGRAPAARGGRFSLPEHVAKIADQQGRKLLKGMPRLLSTLSAALR